MLSGGGSSVVGFNPAARNDAEAPSTCAWAENTAWAQARVLASTDLVVVWADKKPGSLAGWPKGQTRRTGAKSKDEMAGP